MEQLLLSYLDKNQKSFWDTRMKEDPQAFMDDLNHELRTYLNGIMGINRLLSKTPLDEEQVKYVESIEDVSKRLLKVIDRISDSEIRPSDSVITEYPSSGYLSDYAPRILIVEDNMMNQMVVKKTLQKEWKNVRLGLASNGKEAIREIKQNRFDLVLMDIQMPVMDGIEATRIIREKLLMDQETLPIIALTAHSKEEEHTVFKQAGINAVIVKPFNPRTLYGTILMHLRVNTI